MRTRIKYPLAVVIAAGAVAALGQAAPASAAVTAPAARPADRPVIAYVLETPPCMGKTVIVINTATNTALKPIMVGLGVNAIAVTPNGKTVYVVNLIAGTVTPISTATNIPGRPALVKSSPGVTLDGIGIAPDGRTAYILNEIFEPASFPGAGRRGDPSPMTRGLTAAVAWPAGLTCG